MSEVVLNITDISSALQVAENAAREAGDYLARQLGQAQVKHQKSSNDDLLDTDLEAENIILTKFRKETPHIGILSEEAGYEGRQDLYWIIDPLDGSANFQHGSPMFAVAIALATNKGTIASIIYLPPSKEMFSAIKNQGAFLNKQPIHVSQTAALKDAVIHFGDFTKEGDPQYSDEGLRDFSRLALQIRRARMLGSAAIDLAYVSSGRADALINQATQLWDIEAGKLLLTEAGGEFTKIERQHKPLTIYSNSNIHQAIKKLFT